MSLVMVAQPYLAVRKMLTLNLRTSRSRSVSQASLQSCRTYFKGHLAA